MGQGVPDKRVPVDPGPASGPFTMTQRMCDDDGMVSNTYCDPPIPNMNLTYLQIHNNMRRHHDPRGGIITEPFACTGSAHMSGEHILCTSPAHTRVSRESNEGNITLSPRITIQGLVSNQRRLLANGSSSLSNLTPPRSVRLSG
jgi:hypothetical protein